MIVAIAIVVAIVVDAILVDFVVLARALTLLCFSFAGFRYFLNLAFWHLLFEKNWHWSFGA